MGCTCMNRRDFLGLSAGMTLGVGLVARAAAPTAKAFDWAAEGWDPDRPFKIAGRPLRVQPILMYRVPERREAASWKSWGGVQTENARRSGS